MNLILILILALIIGGGFFAYQKGYIKFGGESSPVADENAVVTTTTTATAADTPSVSVQGVSLANSE